MFVLFYGRFKRKNYKHDYKTKMLGHILNYLLKNSFCESWTPFKRRSFENECNERVSLISIEIIQFYFISKFMNSNISKIYYIYARNIYAGNLITISDI